MLQSSVNANKDQIKTLDQNHILREIASQNFRMTEPTSKKYSEEKKDSSTLQDIQHITFICP